MAPAASIVVRIQQDDFDLAQEARALQATSQTGGDVGALVTFTGICRAGAGENAISAMVLEHYPGMAEAEIGRQAKEACARWPLMGVTIIHRFGRIVPGEQIMMVATASAHRASAFAAAEFLMDYLKTHAPFWKREERADGTDWVAARDEDDAALARWSDRAK